MVAWRLEVGGARESEEAWSRPGSVRSVEWDVSWVGLCDATRPRPSVPASQVIAGPVA